MDIKKILEYQKKDAELNKLEKELVKSECKKIYQDMISVVKQAQDKSASLEAQAGYIKAEIDRLNKSYKENSNNVSKVSSKDFSSMKEEEMASQVLGLLKKYKPDILVLTGHDSFSRSKREKYKNTSSFVNAVNEAREYEKSHEKLFIIAGACQSNYENLIKAGANFASSPKRINIHALDPAIIAACLSFSDKNSNIDIIKILDKTKYGASGMGGIITKGSMYIGYPR